MNNSFGIFSDSLEANKDIIYQLGKECKKLQEENEVQRERIKSLENINIQNEFIIQELRHQFTQEVKKKSGEYKILK